MRGVIRRAEFTTSDTRAKEILTEGEFGVLSTISPDGYPYGVPVNYWYKDNMIYFHCAPEGHKLENIKANNNVSFCVVGSPKVLPEKFTASYESVIVFGKAYEVSGSEKENAMMDMVKRFSPEFLEKGKEMIKKLSPRTAIYKIVVETLTGKAR
ncbi:MAG: pyridoxamine 5'-phosphate oxidase family protein [Ignavibacteria bacterium]|jgi:nitroimidazol reductase NimA-like FMN-containing flavoprotein (pyridoxamine 5'-phosphate oxidase superfamily)|nr:pyridoxamine 5'-phosphate oxidase family protein [Ignavibacteria bacterium]MCU7505154.1 pyridoxamine 5'-phosphate oxidase family protein [Ignavibacteria bacterium]MCU7517993.1 pyridoxamine 5'-phosphate oxidase family protein [Ignavibacteria bacterium]